MTTRVAIEAERVIDGDLAAELEAQAAWVSAAVSDVRVEADGRTVSFAVAVEGESESGEIERHRQKVARFVADIAERHRPLPRRVLARRDRARSLASGDAFAELKRRGWVVQAAPGRASLRGPALAVVRAIDEDCAGIGGELGASEEAHPALSSTSVLARCGWFASFPHAASLVAHLTEDYDAIDRFRRDNAGAADLVQPAAGALAPFGACLLPALCYAVYASREGTQVAAAGDADAAAVTCAGRCFRYESRNLSGIERLWDFGMREIVFLGSDDAVGRSRTAAIGAILDQLERWDLQGTVETANDPFFPAARAARAHWQRSGERKLEVRLPVALDGDAPRTIAVASVNRHDRFFGTTFSITCADGNAAATACAGWGMERWMLACFAQHGFDPKGWPEWLRHRVFH
jgi:hypothetical protein